MSWQWRSELWRHFRQPVGAGGVQGADITVRVKSPAGGQRIELDIRLTPECDIADVGFRCFGGVAYIASASWFGERIIGLSATELKGLHIGGGLQSELQEALQLNPTEVPAALLVGAAVTQLLNAWPAQ